MTSKKQGPKKQGPKKAGSKKGIILTGCILGVITVASFMVWMIPQNPSITVSDFEGHLEGVGSIHMTISGTIDASFEDLLEGRTDPQTHIEAAEAATDQINTQIIHLVSSRAPDQWHDAYLAYVDALKAQNSIIRETVVVAGMIRDGNQDGIGQSLDMIGQLRTTMESLITASGQAAP